MTDRDLLEKKLAFIETCVSELQRLARPELVESDVREERFVAHTLQLAIQAALDAASHVVSALRLGEPETNRDLFRLLQPVLTMPEDLVDRLQKMAGFRNILVHGYAHVDRRVLRHILENNLGDLLAFVQAIRNRFPI